jgi:hypothetical protein
MGGDCSKCFKGHNIEIVGHGNSALIINGVTFNITSMLEPVITLTIKQYRFEMITMHFASIFLVLLFVFIIIRYLMSHRHVNGKAIMET